MKKIIHFSQISVLDKYLELADFKSEFQIFKNELNLSPRELLNKKYDIIELGSGDFELFRPLLPTLDLKTSRFGIADTMFNSKTEYRPMHLLSESVYKAIITKVPDLKTSESAIVIGDYDFVLALTYKLAQSGFYKIIISTYKNSDAEKIKKLVLNYAFGIQISTVPLTELTQLESDSVLLISNLSKKSSPEAYESITYFNFLSPGAAFIDLNSRNEPILAEEAKRAEIIVIDEVEILRIKYEMVLEIFKNSPLV